MNRYHEPTEPKLTIHVPPPLNTAGEYRCRFCSATRHTIEAHIDHMVQFHYAGHNEHGQLVWDTDFMEDEK